MRPRQRRSLAPVRSWSCGRLICYVHTPCNHHHRRHHRHRHQRSSPESCRWSLDLSQKRWMNVCLQAAPVCTLSRLTTEPRYASSCSSTAATHSQIFASQLVLTRFLTSRQYIVTSDIAVALNLVVSAIIERHTQRPQTDKQRCNSRYELMSNKDILFCYYYKYNKSRRQPIAFGLFVMFHCAHLISDDGKFWGGGRRPRDNHGNFAISDHSLAKCHVRRWSWFIWLCKTSNGYFSASKWTLAIY